MGTGPLGFSEILLSFSDLQTHQGQLQDRNSSDGLETLIDDGEENGGAAVGQRSPKHLVVRRNKSRSEHNELTQILRTHLHANQQNRAEKRRVRQNNIDRERRRYEEECKRQEDERRNGMKLPCEDRETYVQLALALFHGKDVSFLSNASNLGK